MTNVPVYIAVFVALFCGFVGAGIFHAVFNWGLYRMALSFDYRLTDLEGRVTRETKIRASAASKSKKEREEELMEAAHQTLSGQQVMFPNLQQWKQQKFKTQ